MENGKAAEDLLTEEVDQNQDTIPNKFKFIREKPTAEQRKSLKLKKQKRRARIIIRNLSYKVKEDDIRTALSKYGNILEVNLLQRPDGKLVGCGFVQFEKVTNAAKAILKENGKELLGRSIHIDWAVDKDRYSKHVKNRVRETATLYQTEVKEEQDDVKVKIETNTEVKDENQSDNDSDSDSESVHHKMTVKQESELDKKPRRKSDLFEGCTVFIKNIPFDVTNQDFGKCCKQFGAIYYALINRDPVSQHSKGTGFVKFKIKDSADMCLRAGTEFKLNGQILDPCPALSRQDIKTKSESAQQKHSADSRNLYLIKEGVILAGSTAAKEVSSADMAKRLRLEQLKSQMLKNLNRFLAKERLTVHNIPPSYDNQKFRTVVEKYTLLKPKECRIMRENRPSVGQPSGKSKGFGFLSFKTHEDALFCLRKLNNNPLVFGKNNRPIVSFSIEDKSVHNLKKKRLEKSREKNPLFQSKNLKSKSKNKEKSSEVNGNKVKPNIDLKPKNKIKPKNIPQSTFSGMVADPNAQPARNRPNWKLRDESKVHLTNLNAQKKEAKRKREAKEIQLEKRNRDRPLKRKRVENDDFSAMVSKYKKLIDGTETTVTAKRSKWYIE